MSVTRAPGRRIAPIAALVAAAALLLTGCQTGAAGAPAEVTAAIDLPPLSELTPIEDPTSWDGPSTAPVGGPSLDPIATHPEQQLPATVVSHDSTGDTEVTVTDTSRLLALSLTGTLAELVDSYGLSD